MKVIEIPVSNKNQTMDIVLGGKAYHLEFTHNQYNGWIIDIYSHSREVLAQGIAMLAGIDLLEQYKHLGINGALIFLCNDQGKENSYDELGVGNRLYFLNM
ncbi:phage baseplate plug protein [Morganella morganii]|uniref:phage baseplate plug family protein n=1 Tax=Morganella morganii TaxID=582 RepID=UPI0038646C08